jgi:Kef-type K+ transport system membrane component KefB
VGVSVLDDLPAIALLTLALVLGSRVGPGPCLGLGGLVLGVLVAWASFPLSSWWLRRHGAFKTDPLGVILLLIACSWFGEFTGLTSLLGALWGGVLLGRLAPMAEASAEARELRNSLGLLSDVFLPLYFIGVGMRIELSTLQQLASWQMTVVLIALAVALKLICALGISRRDQAAGVDRWVVVFGLIPRGVPGLVFASTALGTGVISPLQYSALVLMVMVTTVLGLLLLGQRLQTLSPSDQATES